MFNAWSYLALVSGDGSIIEGSGTSGGEGLFCRFLIAFSSIAVMLLGVNIFLFFFFLFCMNKAFTHTVQQLQFILQKSESYGSNCNGNMCFDCSKQEALVAGQWVQEVEMEAWPGLGSPSLEQNQVQTNLCTYSFKLCSKFIYSGFKSLKEQKSYV